jgi:hypothetical protein
MSFFQKMILLNAMQRTDKKYPHSAFLYENNYVNTLPNRNQTRIHTIFFFSSLFLSNTSDPKYLFISSEWRTLFFMCKYTESDALRCLVTVDCFRSYVND